MDIMKTEKDVERKVENSRGNVFRTPGVDIFENDEDYILYYDVPGIEKDDLDIHVEKNLLTLRAEYAKVPGDEYACLKDEMVYSGFRRSFDLGNAVDSEKIEAEYVNGSLKVTLPKKAEQKTRQIPISIA